MKLFPMIVAIALFSTESAFAAYSGDCVQYSSPNGIVCWKGDSNVYYKVGIVVVSGADRVTACSSVDGSSWARVGWADAHMGGVDVPSLAVVGTDVGERIAVQQYAANLGTDCNFTDFSSQFTSLLEIYGDGGSDKIEGSQYDDTFLEGELVYGYSGDDYIALSDDGYFSTYGYYVAYGGSDNDTIEGTSNSAKLDWMDGGSGNDTISGFAGTDYIYGNDGDDTLRGYYGLDYIYGGNDDDYIYGGGDRDYLYGNGGDDIIDGTSGEPPSGGIDMLYGGEGNDTLTENDGDCDGEGNDPSPHGDTCSCIPANESNCEF